MKGGICISISIKLREQMAASSSITRMFEEKVGEKEFYDFTLGNPEIETPPKFTAELKRIVNNPFPGMYRYTPIAGYTKTREAIAKTISKERGLSFSAQHVIMTAGCAGALNIALKALLNPGEEVIILAPSYMEYPYYIDNHGGTCRMAETNQDFTINIDNMASQINSGTKAIILNSPNNPTGEIYSEKTLNSLLCQEGNDRKISGWVQEGPEFFQQYFQKDRMNQLWERIEDDKPDR